jgi:hypothetical protein
MTGAPTCGVLFPVSGTGASAKCRICRVRAVSTHALEAGCRNARGAGRPSQRAHLLIIYREIDSPEYSTWLPRPAPA